LLLLLYFFAGVDRLDEVDDLDLYLELLRAGEDLDDEDEDLYLYFEPELPVYVLDFTEEKPLNGSPFVPLEYLYTFFDVAELPLYLYAASFFILEIPDEDLTVW
jgi:hypothetical protein